jgi:hypothetical protein
MKKKFKLSLFIVLVIISIIFFYNKNNNNLLVFDSENIPVCKLAFKDFKWSILKKNIELSKLELDEMPGHTQGIQYERNKNLIITANGGPSNNINIYNFLNKTKVSSITLPIAAAGITTIKNNQGEVNILVTDYNTSEVLYLDKDLNVINVIKLPKDFKSIVGITNLDDGRFIVPSRSNDKFAVIELANTKEIGIFRSNIDDNNNVTYDIEYSNGCFFLNYREVDKILLGYFDNNIFKIKDINIRLNYPQGIWLYDQKLFVIETGTHSLIEFNLYKMTKTIFQLPRGVYRSISGRDDKNLILSGQVFTEKQEDILSTISVTDEENAIVHNLKF